MNQAVYNAAFGGIATGVYSCRFVLFADNINKENA